MKNPYLLILLSTLGIVLCDKNGPSEISTVKNANDSKINKSFEFLHKIKEDLRRNNDDYGEVIAKTITTNAQALVHSDLKFHYTKENPNILDDLKRRAYESLSEEEDVKDIKEITSTAKTTAKITQTAKPTESKVIKNINKFKTIFQNSNDLLKEFVRNRAMSTTQKIGGKPTIRMRAQDNAKKIILPTSEQLDMAPAKGGRIHMLRIKGRLCQRNVLIPEGPKYDSKGNIYLPAFASAVRHKKFENTIAPKIILPRCCNCCKKSVLGCE